MPIQTTANISADISYTIVDNSNGQTFSENGSLGYRCDLVSGTGVSGINAVSFLSGILNSGESYRLDLQAIPKYIFGSAYNVNFLRLKSVAIENKATVSGQDISIRATGSNAFTNIFNSGSGNVLVKPKAVYMYSDPLGALPVSVSQRYLYLRNNSNSGLPYKIILAGVSG